MLPHQRYGEVPTPTTGAATPVRVTSTAPSIEYSGAGRLGPTPSTSPYYSVPVPTQATTGAEQSASPWRAAVGSASSSPAPLQHTQHTQQQQPVPTPYGVVVHDLVQSDALLPSMHANSTMHNMNEAIWKQRVKDRDDVVRDLMKRIVQLEHENEQLHQRVQDVALKHHFAKDCGTNTTFEWVVEQQQRSQLIALEEYMRFQEVCLYAEWFGLSLAYHRQVFHTLRMQQQLTTIADTMHRGIITPHAAVMGSGGPSTASAMSLSPARQYSVQQPSYGAGDGDVTLLRLRGVMNSPPGAAPSGSSSSSLMLRASVGAHTPSSATGAALHLLRGLDALQSSSLERITQDIQHGCVMVQRRNRSQLREAANVHEQLVLLHAQEASARHALEQESLATATQLFHIELSQKLRAAADRQVRLLTIDNKRMLEFSLSQSTAHHRVAQELSHCQHAAAAELQLVEQQSVAFAEEATRREVTRAQAHEWSSLLGPAQAGWALAAQAREELRRHSQNLEGSNITLRHGEEPWSRRFIELMEAGERSVLQSSRGEVISQVQHMYKGFERREGSRGAEVLQHEYEAVGSSFVESHRLFLDGVRVTLVGLEQAIRRGEGRIRSRAEQQLVLINTEVKSREGIEELRVSEYLRLMTQHVREVEGDKARQHTRDVLEDAQHAYSRDILRFTGAHRKDVLEYTSSVTAQTSRIVADAVQDGNDALARLSHFVRKASRVERDEQRWRTEILLQEKSDYCHCVLLPFVLSLRECELNEEYGTLFVNVEDQTRKIMRRATERESAHVDYFADEGLVQSHIDVGEALLEQHSDFCKSIGMFLRDDVRRSHLRIKDTCKVQHERDVERIMGIAAKEREELEEHAAAHVEQVRRTTSAFWKDVYTTEAARLQSSWLRFASSELLDWYRSLQEEVSRLVGQLWRHHKTLHTSSQTAQLDYVLNGPVAALVARQYQSGIDLVQGVHVSVKSLQRSLSDVSVTGQQEVKELLELKEVRYKQQVQHSERLYMECRLQLDKEVRLRDGERILTHVIAEEQRRRAELHATEAHELLWFVYRSNTVQRFLIRTSSSLSPNRAGGGGGSHWPQAARAFVTSPTTSNGSNYPRQQLTSALAPSSSSTASHFARGNDALSAPTALISQPQPQQRTLASSSFLSTLASSRMDESQNPLGHPATAASAPQRQGSISGTVRSGSETSSMFGTARSDLDSTTHQIARARRSSLVMSRSMERQRSLRGEGEGSPEPRYTDVAVSDRAGRHMNADGVILGDFSPSPLTRAELVSRNERHVQSQMRMI